MTIDTVFPVIPTQRPETPLLDLIQSPADLRRLPIASLPALAEQLRAFLLYSVGQTGGHFGAGLGIVELTIALHYAFDTPDDRVVWDVGHQCYPHKILTGRREQLLSIRQAGGLAPFPKREESRYDTFGVGHSSTSISAALGMALAARLQGEHYRAIAVIGDGAMTGGMAFEALNHAAHTHTNLLVILNDNDMSISPNEGGLATYFDRNLRSRTGSSTTASMFEALEFHYSGPIDGHDLDALIRELSRLRRASGPQFLHVRTLKGKGFLPAERDPVGYHAITKLPAPTGPTKTVSGAPQGQKYSDVFGQWLCAQAGCDTRLVGITPAMSEGSGMVGFAERFPARYFDVAIAEQHAVTLAAGLASAGSKPVLAIYSTFLQRGYDQLIHDVALQNLDVLFAIDRAGLVGEDGPTHHGSFDLSYLRCIPNLVIMAPSDEAETHVMLSTGYHYAGPACVRYPRGKGPGVTVPAGLQMLDIGRSRTVREGAAGALLCFGTLLETAKTVAAALDLTLVDMRFIKPLDGDRIIQLSTTMPLLVTLEENAIAGGAGSGVNEFLAAQGIVVPILNLGLADHYVEHAAPAQQLSAEGLDAAGIQAQIEARLARLALSA